jgi:hypothetical protein
MRLLPWSSVSEQFKYRKCNCSEAAESVILRGSAQAEYWTSACGSRTKVALMADICLLLRAVASIKAEPELPSQQ